MYRNINLKRDCIKVGNSIFKVKKDRKKSESPVREVEIKMKNMIFDKKKIKPLSFKF